MKKLVYLFVLLVSTLTHAQVKIGANPGTIGSTSNLEVEATNGNKTIVDKASGQVTIQDGSQGDGKLLTSDANGKASWQLTTQSTPSIVSAEGSATQQIAVGQNYLSFGTERIDRNNDFDSNTGIFTAPSNGIYTISANITVSGQAIYQRGRIGLGLIAEIVSVRDVYLAGGIAYENDWGYANSTTTVVLTAGQQVRIRLDVAPGETTNQNRTLEAYRHIEITKISN